MKLQLLALASLGAVLLSSSGGSHLTPTSTGGARRHAHAAATPSTWTVDPAHSSIVFETKHLGVSKFYGSFDAFEGEIDYSPDKPTDGAAWFTIDATSIDTRSDGRDKHLRSPDFLSAKEFPEIHFESTSVEGSGDTLTVEGELTLHGVSKTVRAPFEVVGMIDTPRGKKAGFEAKFAIDMRDFDFSFVKANPDAVGPIVNLIVSVECSGQ